ncbi:MAG: hypothetical protein AAF394_02200 [Planctomycetota bacterium]
MENEKNLIATDEDKDPLAALVAGGMTIRAAAEELGIPERTAYRRSTEQAFRDAVAQIQLETIRSLQGKLVEASSKAVEVLTEVLESGTPSAKVQAAKAILGQSKNIDENLEFRERLQWVEQLATKRKEDDVSPE